MRVVSWKPSWRRAVATPVVVATAALGLIGVASTSASATPTTTRVSVTSTGGQSKGGVSDTPSISSDGHYVAFASTATNLAPGDTNAVSDIFVRDTVAGTTTRVSVASDGTQSNGVSDTPWISADGRYVAFRGNATNLVAGDTNGHLDIFVHDMVAGTTSLVSVATDGTQGDNDSAQPFVSADGRYIVFQSMADNLVSGDLLGKADIFLRDQTLGTTERVSLSSTGGSPTGGSQWPSVSADGRYVAFSSVAANIAANSNTIITQIYVRDRESATNSVLSIGTDGKFGNQASTQPQISADGSTVVWNSLATNLVTGDTNAHADIFFAGRSGGPITRISTGPGGVQADGDSDAPSVDADGQVFAFDSTATDLVSGDTNGVGDTFVYDLPSATLSLASITTAGAQGTVATAKDQISASGSQIAFRTASALIPTDTNAVVDIYVHDLDNQPRPDLQTTISGTPNPAAVGAQITYTVGVTNNGTGADTDTTVTVPVPATASFVSGSAPGGVCTLVGATVSCPVGPLSIAGSATAQIVLTRNSPGSLAVTASATSPQADLNPADNSASTSTTVTLPDLAVTASVAATPVDSSSHLVATAVVTNNGLVPATNVTVSVPIPSGATAGSAVVDATPCTLGTTVVCSIGTLAAGAQASAVVTISSIDQTVVLPFTAAESETDLHPADNSASTSGVVGLPQSVLVNPVPVAKAPTVANGKVVAIVEVGNTVVVGGTFTSVRDVVAKVNLPRTNIFAYDRTTKRVSATFVPALDNVVTAMVAGPDGHSVIVAGKFANVNGVKRLKLVKLEVADGSTNSSFAGSAQNGFPNSLAIHGNDLFVGGTFTVLTGVARSGLGALDATTGTPLSWLNIPVTQPRAGTPSSVLKVAVAPDESRLILIGNFLNVGGFARNQIAMIDLTVRPAIVSSWDTQAFVGACSTSFETYMRDIDISPDSTYFVAVATGSYRAPPSLCDATSKWALKTTGPNQLPLWVNYTGGDTLYSVAITPVAIYIGGHERWTNNPYAGDSAGPGAISQPGIGALDPLTGVTLHWNPTRDRGVGVFALVATSKTLYVGHDTNNIGGAWHPRLAEFTVTGGTPVPTPVATPLPVVIQRPQTDGSLAGTQFDGTNYAANGTTQAAGGAINWSQVRGSFYQNGYVYYEYSDSAFYKVSFDGTNFGAPVNLTTAAPYVAPPKNFNNTITSLAYDPGSGRIVYTRTGDARIFWRWFSLESGIVGGEEKVAYNTNTSGINGLDIAGGTLYASTTANDLFTVPFGTDGSVDWPNRILIDDDSVSGVQWGAPGDMFMTPFSGTVPPNTGGSSCATGLFTARYFSNQSLSGTPTTTRCESTINNDYGSGAPSGTGLPVDHFSIIWNGSFNFAGGNETFTTTADDGVRVLIDGKILIDKWVDQSTATYSATINLAAGIHTVRMEYYENTGGAVAILNWTP